MIPAEKENRKKLQSGEIPGNPLLLVFHKRAEFLQVFCVTGNFYANHIESSSVVRKAKFLKRTKHFKVIRDFYFLERKTAAKIFHFLHKTILSNKKNIKK